MPGATLHNWRKSSLWPVLIVFLIWKTIMLTSMTFALIKVHEPGNLNYNPPTHSGQIMRATFKWDAYYYLRVAEDGYGTTKNALPVFFPLFPYSVKAVSTALHVGPVAAGYLINTIASFFAFLFMYLLALDFFKRRRHAVAALLLFAFFPFSYFMSAFYTEALFCALSLGAFYFARRRMWWAACSMLAFLTASRFPAVIVAMAIFIEYLSSIQFRWRRINLQILWFALAPIGLLLYMWHLYQLFGDPLFFRNAYTYGWQYQSFQPNIFLTLWREVTGLWNMLWHHTAGTGWAESFLNELIFFGSWVVGVAVLIFGAIKIKALPASYTFYGLASMLLFSINSNFISANRYLLPLFPIFLIVTGITKNNETARSLLLAASAVGLGLFLTQFSNGFWTG